MPMLPINKFNITNINAIERPFAPNLQQLPRSCAITKDWLIDFKERARRSSRSGPPKFYLVSIWDKVNDFRWKKPNSLWMAGQCFFYCFHTLNRHNLVWYKVKRNALKVFRVKELITEEQSAQLWSIGLMDIRRNNKLDHVLSSVESFWNWFVNGLFTEQLDIVWLSHVYVLV